MLRRSRKFILLLTLAFTVGLGAGVTRAQITRVFGGGSGGGASSCGSSACTDLIPAVTNTSKLGDSSHIWSEAHVDILSVTSTANLPATGVGAGSCTNCSVTFDASGRATSKSSGATPALASTTLTGGTGINSIGDLSTNRTISLANTAVTPASYTYGGFTVDQQGRLTAASSGAAPALASQTITTVGDISFSGSLGSSPTITAPDNYTAAKTITVDDASNNTSTTVLNLVHTTSGTPGAGIASGILFKTEDSGNNTQNICSIQGTANVVTDTSEEGYLRFACFNGAVGTAAAAESFRAWANAVSINNTAKPSVPLEVNRTSGAGDSIRLLVGGTHRGGIGIYSGDGASPVLTSQSAVFYSPYFYPIDDNGRDLGSNVLRWNAIFARQHVGVEQAPAISSNAVTTNAALGEVAKVSLTANVTTHTMTAGKPAQRMTIITTQDATGGRTWAWASNIRWLNGGAAPTVTAAAGAKDMYGFLWDNGSTVWLETRRSQNIVVP